MIFFEDNWVCLKCGIDRHIRTNDPVLAIIVFSAIALMVILMINARIYNHSGETLQEETFKIEGREL
ncbi:MAG TPA: hypothetical protein DCQ63_01500 [Planktothrix sp. UBA8402]|nr:hypothetical protein [Planktothrix sp. UBA8402]